MTPPQITAAAVVRHAPAPYARALRHWLKDNPEAQVFTTGGPFLIDIAVVGPPEQIRDLVPRLEAWEHEFVSRSAW